MDDMEPEQSEREFWEQVAITAALVLILLFAEPIVDFLVGL